MTKAWTAARARKPTQQIWRKGQTSRAGLRHAYYGDRDLSDGVAGIPVWKDGEVAGAIAVSGLFVGGRRRLSFPRCRTA